MTRWDLPRQVRRATVATVVASTIVAPLAAQTRDEPNLDALYRIKQEATTNSKVMETLSYLTDVHGPRLTNSPLMHQAAEWTQQQLKSWGLANVHTEKWGPFGRGWVNEHTSVRLDSPQPFVMLGYPQAWTPGTDGEVSGEAVAVAIEKDEDFARFKGQLKGKFVLQSPAREVAAYFESPTRRYTESGLDELSREQIGPARRFPGFPGFGPGAQEFRKKRMAFYKDEGVLAVVEMSAGARGDNGTVIAQGPAPGDGDRTVEGQMPVPNVVLAAEHYGRLLRVLDKKLPVK